MASDEPMLALKVTVPLCTSSTPFAYVPSSLLARAMSLCDPDNPCVCLQCRMECRDVPAETLYDVLHDIEYRKKWDSNVIETFDIARLTVNADVGYYSCEQAQAHYPASSRPAPGLQLSLLLPPSLLVVVPMAMLLRNLSAEI